MTTSSASKFQWVAGTPAFMSPRLRAQLKNKIPPTNKSNEHKILQDLYALGILLLMLSYKLPNPKDRKRWFKRVEENRVIPENNWDDI